MPSPLGAKCHRCLRNKLLRLNQEVHPATSFREVMETGRSERTPASMTALDTYIQMNPPRAQLTSTTSPRRPASGIRLRGKRSSGISAELVISRKLPVARGMPAVSSSRADFVRPAGLRACGLLTRLGRQMSGRKSRQFTRHLRGAVQNGQPLPTTANLADVG